MSKIIKLPSHVADLIAAGEVVQRPASVVKELIENAIDAGAGIITVEIKDGGMTFIRVSDNGSGISPEDVKVAFLRHATSKIRDAAGLEAIGTLGFRGEALAAIAAVSRIELTTREQGSDEGVRITLKAGEPGDVIPYGCPEGTTIIVGDLFFNTPARLKFIKSNRAEGAKVASTVLFAALSHPEISVRFIKDGKTEYHTPGDFRADSCIYSLFGRDFSSGLVKVNSNNAKSSPNSECRMQNAELSSNPQLVQGAKSGGFETLSVNEYNKSYGKTQKPSNKNNFQLSTLNSQFGEAAHSESSNNSAFCILHSALTLPSVSGYISNPNMSRGNRGFQFFILNGRPIRSKVLQAALEQAYTNLLPSGRFPSCVLYITTKLSDVDVNVHPTKTEVKFISDKQVFDAVYYAAKGALDKPNAECRMQNAESSPNSECRMQNAELSSSSQFAKDAKRGGFETLSVNEYNESYGKTQKPSNKNNFQLSTFNSQFDEAAHSESSNNSAFCILHSALDNNSEFKLIGETMSTYIILELSTQDALVFIDKHAAHERIHFNALKSGNYDPMSQTLIVPTICRFSAEDASLLLENADFLDTLGFSIESFGGDSIAVRRIPSEIGINDVEPILSNICQHLEHGNLADSQRLDKIYRTIACGSSIKAGTLSEARELEALATRVLSGEITHCPHGRPVMFELSKSTLDKEFKRI